MGLREKVEGLREKGQRLREKGERLLAPENFGPAAAGVPTYMPRRQKSNSLPTHSSEQADDYAESNMSGSDHSAGMEPGDETTEKANQPKQMHYWGPRTMTGSLALYNAVEYDPES